MAAAACARGPRGRVLMLRGGDALTMVNSTAVPIAPPICWLVLTIAEPTPASSSGTPAVAVAMAGAKVIPTPKPSTISGATKNAPAAAVVIPAGTSGLGPTGGPSGVLARPAETAIPAANGRNATPV